MGQFKCTFEPFQWNDPKLPIVPLLWNKPKLPFVPFQ